jgi:hypothetical protein
MGFVDVQTAEIEGDNRPSVAAVGPARAEGIVQVAGKVELSDSHVEVKCARLGVAGHDDLVSHDRHGFGDVELRAAEVEEDRDLAVGIEVVRRRAVVDAAVIEAAVGVQANHGHVDIGDSRIRLAGHDNLAVRLDGDREGLVVVIAAAVEREPHLAVGAEVGVGRAIDQEARDGEVAVAVGAVAAADDNHLAVGLHGHGRRRIRFYAAGVEGSDPFAAKAKAGVDRARGHEGALFERHHLKLHAPIPRRQTPGRGAAVEVETAHQVLPQPAKHEISFGDHANGERRALRRAEKRSLTDCGCGQEWTRCF